MLKIEQIVGREGVDVRADPVPQYLRGRALPPKWSSVNLGSVSTLSMLPRDRSTSRLNPVSAYLIPVPFSITC